MFTSLAWIKLNVATFTALNSQYHDSALIVLKSELCQNIYGFGVLELHGRVAIMRLLGSSHHWSGRLFLCGALLFQQCWKHHVCFTRSHFELVAWILQFTLLLTKNHGSYIFSSPKLFDVLVCIYLFLNVSWIFSVPISLIWLLFILCCKLICFTVVLFIKLFMPLLIRVMGQIVEHLSIPPGRQRWLDWFFPCLLSLFRSFLFIV